MPGKKFKAGKGKSKPGKLKTSGRPSKRSIVRWDDDMNDYVGVVMFQLLQALNKRVVNELLKATVGWLNLNISKDVTLGALGQHMGKLRLQMEKRRGWQFPPPARRNKGGPKKSHGPEDEDANDWQDIPEELLPSHIESTTVHGDQGNEEERLTPRVNAPRAKIAAKRARVANSIDRSRNMSEESLESDEEVPHKAPTSYSQREKAALDDDEYRPPSSQTQGRQMRPMGRTNGTTKKMTSRMMSLIESDDSIPEEENVGRRTEEANDGVDCSSDSESSESSDSESQKPSGEVGQFNHSLVVRLEIGSENLQRMIESSSSNNYLESSQVSFHDAAEHADWIPVTDQAEPAPLANLNTVPGGGVIADRLASGPYYEKRPEPLDENGNPPDWNFLYEGLAANEAMTTFADFPPSGSPLLYPFNFTPDFHGGQQEYDPSMQPVFDFNQHFNEPYTYDD